MRREENRQQGAREKKWNADDREYTQGARQLSRVRSVGTDLGHDRALFLLFLRLLFSN